MSGTTDSAKGGFTCSFGIGSVLAAILSYHVNASIAWAILHFICGWFYVLYYLFVHVDLFAWLDKIGK